ncbi:FAD-dependent thymidylate synthase [bacterium]|nr:FAD-dependent thymidylate synthase [bacterium]
MKVVLAGYNVDATILEELKTRANWSEDNVTPESLSASYARISRDSRDIGELRSDARASTSTSRKSNKAIIFGLGHASVAEHAVFNLDITGLSRLATESLQQFRLVSFTEKSQRYITLDGDAIIPKEIVKAGFSDKFSALIKRQNEIYSTLYTTIQKHLFTKYAEKIKKPLGKMTVDGWAKEDARYVVALATETQMGMTVNARTLEHMIRKLAASPLLEVRELADNLYNQAHNLAPSVIKYTEPTPYDTARITALKKSIAHTISSTPQQTETELVSLVSHTPNPDSVLVSSLLFAYGTASYAECFTTANNMNAKQKQELISVSLANKESYDKPDRAFESVKFSFELAVSATNYAQLKRHRIATQLPQPYNLSLGITTPDIIGELQLSELFTEAIIASEQLYEELISAGVKPVIAEYALTNAHRRKVLVDMNARELYHFIALRSDQHAQWDIQNSSNAMKNLAQKVAPMTTMALLRKDN